VLGLVLTAGGARGAYQAGVLKRMGQIPALRGKPSPFAIVAGASAGAINGSMVAALGGDFQEGTRALAHLWCRLEIRDVFRADAWSLGTNVGRLARDMLLGWLVGGGRVHSLLDASPLRGFLAQRLPLEGIGDAIRRGHLYAVAVSATSYHSGKSFIFIQGRPGHPTWSKTRRITLPVELTLDHVLASAAIPIVFQPVLVRSEVGSVYLGDGGLRLVAPLSPAIRLGATHVVAIGVRSHRSAEELARAELLGGHEPGADDARLRRPPLAQVCGVFLNAIFLDHLDTDLDHLKRMNELIDESSAVAHATISVLGKTVNEPMRLVTPLALNPSEDLAIVAKSFEHRMPRLVRAMMDGLGTPNAQSADLMSYLLFDREYTRTLVDIGYHDASARIAEIESFLCDRPAVALAG